MAGVDVPHAEELSAYQEVMKAVVLAGSISFVRCH